MSFVGAVDATVRQALASFAPQVRWPVLLCGAGNFTMAAALRSGGYTGPISACDVSYYTSALGCYLSGQPFEVRERSSCPPHLRGLLRSSTPLETATSISLLLDLREVWKLRNPYQERQFRRVVDNWPQLMERTAAKLEAYSRHLGDIEYRPQGGLEFLDAHDTTHTVLCYPPTYKRGYEKLEQVLTEVVDWSPPAYSEIADDSVALSQSLSRFAAYYVVLERPIPEVQAILGEPVAVLPRTRGRKTYILARSATRKLVVRSVVKSVAIGPVWPAERPITGQETIGLARLSLPQTIRLNELFLSARIDYFSSGVSLSLGLLLDGSLCGKMDFCHTSHRWKLPDAQSMIYLMSDLAVPSCERRLAKLVLLALLSREVMEVLKERHLEVFGWVGTTAFAINPVSMKYRGVFELHSRKDIGSGYALNYLGQFTNRTLQQAFAFWKQKYQKNK